MPHSRPLSRLRASLILLLVSFIWGSAFVAQKTAFDAVEGATAPALGPLAFTGARFLLGALVVLPFALRENRQARSRGAPGAGLLAIFCGIGAVLFAASFTQQLGIIGTSVTNAGFLTALYVPLVPVVALVIFRQSVRKMIWPGAAGCLAGLWLLTGAATNGLSALTAGDLWVLVGALFWAFHVTVVGVMATRSGRPLTLAAAQFLTCGVLGWAGAFAFETPTLAGMAAIAPEIAYAGILSVGVAFTLQVVAQRHTHPAAAAIILSMEMVFASLAAVVVLGERLSGVQWLGAGLILASIIAVESAAALGDRRRGAAGALTP
ncbi:hypothetical protein F11_11025 [Rhodospirillum rubrum F11]|uniref:EamA domain-containing protein n=1 Tax=Rhodospirillum rubrum (strain ATCC 11170 / ATH 1.1.1 / DSM 467 / LMG 4362 / NCIMB 8255 / S1) TaxID=269796 RepID=Q2RSF4_RHORT|nr:DMT family transporter [Rhodospirillum rubrum]ABC22941.1 Protein of unknown function DUF6, transmembrane [Rhodospirillum rubrum ATCC 11170]AEO48669.1 hypothetical protein F11_11025 [Rhodospirillum rubrum F11]MBK5954562.1 EamA/RhaT family transporter [Rhodospirillum rubrum]QXG78928.1 DMT family transporter [Rhodospirillum rubrum]HCF16573.1 EamA/RhaT family transporter [Rhodospirillum rubrum]